jgi:hypothetical protein
MENTFTEQASQGQQSERCDWQPAIVVDPHPEDIGSSGWSKLVGQRVMVQLRPTPSRAASCVPDEPCGGRAFTVSRDDMQRLGIVGPPFIVCEHQILTD